MDEHRQYAEWLERTIRTMLDIAMSNKNYKDPSIERQVYPLPWYYPDVVRNPETGQVIEQRARYPFNRVLRDTAQHSLGTPIGHTQPLLGPTDWWESRQMDTGQNTYGGSGEQVTLGTSLLPSHLLPPPPAPGPSSWEQMMSDTDQHPLGAPIIRK